jgi:hypothetical protein
MQMQPRILRLRLKDDTLVMALIVDGRKVPQFAWS